jgi:hypothetical protein
MKLAPGQNARAFLNPSPGAALALAFVPGQGQPAAPFSCRVILIRRQGGLRREDPGWGAGGFGARQ